MTPRSTVVFSLKVKNTISLQFFWCYHSTNFIYFRYREKIEVAAHEDMFILHGTMETLPATDVEGRSFTSILSSIVKANGGAMAIKEIAE